MIDVQTGLGIKNISDLVRKEIYGIFETKNHSKKQIRTYERSQKEVDRDSNSSFTIKYTAEE